MSAESPLDAARVDTLIEQLAQVRRSIATVIVGQEEVVEHMLVALLAGGHCLIEGVPGLGKTLLVNSLAEAMSLGFRRIQFTPDLMPSDIIGTEVLEEDHTTGKRFFKFQPGPVFTDILLADEINRTPAKTQAALLEAMQEKSVTYAGETRSLGTPFFVLATQNPLEQSGTYALPEAQLDRFLLHIAIDYPTAEQEARILKRTTGAVVPTIEAVISAETVVDAQRVTRDVTLSDNLLQYITTLMRATRPGDDAPAAVNEWVKWGAGPRAGQALVLAAKGRALLNGRYAVTRDDVYAMVLPVLRHRLILNFHAQAEQHTVADIVSTLLAHYDAPEDPIGA